MAITASVALSSATATTGQRVAVALTVSNSGGSAVNVTAIRPMMSPQNSTKETTSVAQGVVALGPGATVSVAASGSTVFAYDIIANTPTSGYGLAMPASQVYDVGATVYTSDGAVTDATSTTLTASDPIP
jgi:septal ring-binding cell division protein DamX